MKYLQNLLITMTLIVFALSNLPADDTLYGLIGSSLRPLNGEHKIIEMAAETVTLTLYEDYYELNVDFTFNNKGKEERLLVGFPVTYASKKAKLYDFKAWTNGEPVEREYLPIEQDDGHHVIVIEEDGMKPFDAYKYDNAYVIPILFKTGITTTRVNYKNLYRMDDENKSDHISYYYGSGRKWKNKIGIIEVIVSNKSPYYIDHFWDVWKVQKNQTWLEDNTYSIIYNNKEPVEGGCFEWLIKDLDYNLQNIYGSSWDKDKTRVPYYIFDNNIKYLTKSQLRIFRNSIYAMHGYIFKSEDLQDLFSRMNWYEPNPDYSDSLLSEKQKEFIAKIQKEENSR